MDRSSNGSNDLCTPEHLLSSAIVEDYNATFKRVREVVRAIYSIRPDIQSLLNRSKYVYLEDLIRHQSSWMTSFFIEAYYGEAERSGSFTVNLHEIQDVAREAINEWVMSNRSFSEIAEASVSIRHSSGHCRPSWMPDMGPTIEIARAIRHFAGNALMASEIEPKPRAKDLSAERVTDPAVVPYLWKSRREVYRAVEIASAIQVYAQTKDKEPLKTIWKKVSEEGAFLERYSIEKIQERVANQAEWIIFRAKGRPVMRQDMLWGSDIQIRIPKDEPRAPLALELDAPPGGNFIYRKGQRVADLIRENRAIAGCVSDLRVADEYAHMGFAGEARFRAFQHIQNVINAERQNKIRFLIAEIFSVNGLHLPDWRERKKEAYVPLETPITNVASQIAHTHGRTPAFDGWERTGDKVPVWLPGDAPDKPHFLDVSWTAMVHDLEMMRL